MLKEAAPLSLEKLNPSMINPSMLIASDKYSDKLYDTILQIESEIDKILGYCFNSSSEPIKKLFNTIKQELFEAGYDNDKLKAFYQNRLSDIRKSYIDDLNKNCKGYYLFSDDSRMISEAKSINELLHSIHHCLINNEKIYQGIPSLQNFKSGESTLALRGIKNEMAQSIFDELKKEEIAFNKVRFSDEEDINKRRKNRGIFGETDIISLEKRILIMARNCGHALMIEIKLKDDDSYEVDYFIPKLNNINMINKLPGVRKVKEGDWATTGNFDCNGFDLPYYISRLIGETPRDFDNELIRNFKI